MTGSICATIVVLALFALIGYVVKLGVEATK